MCHLKELISKGGAQEPSLNLGKYETVYVETTIPSENVTLVEFYEGYNYSWLYSSASNWVGKEIFTNADGKSYLEISTTKKDDKGYELVKIDSEGKVGDEAGEDAVWALRTGDWATNGAPNRFSYMNGAPYVGGGYYDLSGFEKIRVKLYVEKTDGYKMMLQFASDPDTNNNNKEGYFGYYINVDKPGWYTLEFDINDYSNKSLGTYNYSPNWDKIKGVGLTVSGWDFGNGGKAKDGTVVYISEITMINTDDGRVNKTAVGSYLVNDSICQQHSLDSGTVVAPEVHVDGYTIYKCANCDYIQIVQNEGTALTHEDIYERDENNYKAPTCEADGENYYKVNCDLCGTITYREIIPRLGHDWVVVEGAEVEAGYELVECTHEGCTRGQVLRKITNDLSAFEE